METNFTGPRVAFGDDAAHALTLDLPVRADRPSEVRLRAACAPPRPAPLARGPRRHHPTGDEALVRAALGGDRAAAAEIFRRHLPTVRKCLRATFASVDLDDGVQSVFASCFQHLPRLRDPASLRSFIIGIALRTAAMERRRRRKLWRERVTATGELPEPTSVRRPNELVDVPMRTRAVLEAMGPGARRMLELRYVHEAELTELASELGVSLATTKRHLARASERMRAMVRGDAALSEYVRDARGNDESPVSRTEKATREGSAPERRRATA